MLDLDESWVWDFWIARDAGTFHCFFLKASRALEVPDLRHWHASVGHAVSGDLTSWTRVADALDPQPAPAFDDLATWTGSVVRGDDGRWRMFTSGLSRAEDGRVQRIGVSTSDDLLVWVREPRPLLEADPRWYAVRGPGQLETHWRDPWVCRDANGIWHLLATARSAATSTAVVAHATSRDLGVWETLPPMTLPSRRFGQAEVVSVQEVEGGWVMLFSCLSDQMPGAEPGAGGVWSVPVPPPASWDGGVDLDAAVRVTDESLYVGKVVQLPDGTWRFLAFRHADATGTFHGGLIDPVSVGWRPDGAGLRVLEADGAWRWPDASLGMR